MSTLPPCELQTRPARLCLRRLERAQLISWQFRMVATSGMEWLGAGEDGIQLEMGEGGEGSI